MKGNDHERPSQVVGDTRVTRLVRWADHLNHWTRPGKGRHWSHALCLYDSELTAVAEGHLKGKPTFRSSWRLARKTADLIRSLPDEPGR